MFGTAYSFCVLAGMMLFSHCMLVKIEGTRKLTSYIPRHFSHVERLGNEPGYLAESYHCTYDHTQYVVKEVLCTIVITLLE